MYPSRFIRSRNRVLALLASSLLAMSAWAETSPTSTCSSSSCSTSSAPAPVISSVTPAVLKPGTFTLRLKGSGFASGAKVIAGDVVLTTQYVSPTSLSASGTVSKPGILPIRVALSSFNQSAPYLKVQVTSDGRPAPNPGTNTGSNSGSNSGSNPTSTPTTTSTPTPGVIGPAPAADPVTITAARFLDQATFGPSATDLAQVKALGLATWITQQTALPASPFPPNPDNSNAAMTALRNTWYTNMTSGKDQLRQRMIFALSQIFVVSSNKNPYANEISPWQQTLSNNAFGNFNTLLREMTLNPAMGKYLDLGNSVTPAPNENYAREVMQLFTVGPNLLNQDGSLQLDGNGNPIPTYDQNQISGMARALSGWTYPGKSSTDLNFENFTGPLQPRDKYHDKGSKTILGGIVLPAGQSTQQDFDAVMKALYFHPNLPPFIATRLIRAFTSSNPSPAYIKRVADVFAYGEDGSGTRGDLAATLKAVLLDPEARQDVPTYTQGHLKDPMLHTLSLVRALNGKVVDPTNIFWDYFLLGQRIGEAPSVFNYYSPMTRLPNAQQYFGPEFQIYSPSQAVARANLLYNLLAGNYKGIINIDLTPYVTAASDPTTLLNLVNTNLLQGRMSAAARAAIGKSLLATSDKTQRALTALYLSAMTAEFAVQR